MGSKNYFSDGHELYEQGKYSEAFSEFMLGADAGDTSCMNRVAAMYTSGEGVVCDYDKAIEWELKAIESGDITSMVNVGISYRIKGDIRKSRYWFEEAIKAGDGSGALNLAKLYMVSDKEIVRIKEYLNIAIRSENMCESDIEEAQKLLVEADGNAI